LTQRQLYGRRRGHRLRPGRRRLLEERLPELQLQPPADGALDPAALFGSPRAVWLEIGFGGGEHLVEQARRHPEVGVIGCEPFVNGVARALALAEAERVHNVRILMDDARLLLPALPDGSLERIFVLFPDPWPKARHHKRRIVNPETVRAFARLLVPGGELRLATDDPGYARWMLAAVLRAGSFEWLAERPGDWRARPADWPPTRYEVKACAAGAHPVYLRFRCRTSDAPDRELAAKGLKAGGERRI
jgi:tRNA (guanine-N7-)-methyltransferase